MAPAPVSGHQVYIPLPAEYRSHRSFAHSAQGVGLGLSVAIGSQIVISLAMMLKYLSWGGPGPE